MYETFFEEEIKAGELFMYLQIIELQCSADVPNVKYNCGKMLVVRRGVWQTWLYDTSQ